MWYFSAIPFVSVCTRKGFNILISILFLCKNNIYVLFEYLLWRFILWQMNCKLRIYDLQVRCYLLFVTQFAIHSCSYKLNTLCQHPKMCDMSNSYFLYIASWANMFECVNMIYHLFFFHCATTYYFDMCGVIEDSGVIQIIIFSLFDYSFIIIILKILCSKKISSH